MLCAVCIAVCSAVYVPTLFSRVAHKIHAAFFSVSPFFPRVLISNPYCVFSLCVSSLSSLFVHCSFIVRLFIVSFVVRSSFVHRSFIVLTVLDFIFSNTHPTNHCHAVSAPLLSCCRYILCDQRYVKSHACLLCLLVLPTLLPMFFYCACDVLSKCAGICVLL